MKNIDLLAKAVAPAEPAPAPATADPDKIAGDLIDKIAARVVELLSEQQTADPEPAPADDPEPEAGGDQNGTEEPGPVD